MARPVWKDVEGYESPYGVWEVTTEADCEGRSSRRLGIFEGRLHHIAFQLADKNYYSLHFTPVQPVQVLSMNPTGKEVNVTLNIKSGAWDLKPDERASHARVWLEGEDDVEVERSNYYATFKLVLPDTENKQETFEEGIRRKLDNAGLTTAEREAIHKGFLSF